MHPLETSLRGFSPLTPTLGSIWTLWLHSAPTCPSCTPKTPWESAETQTVEMMMALRISWVLQTSFAQLLHVGNRTKRHSGSGRWAMWMRAYDHHMQKRNSVSSSIRRNNVNSSCTQTCARPWRTGSALECPTWPLPSTWVYLSASLIFCLVLPLYTQAASLLEP